MKLQNSKFITINSISELHKLLGLPKPQHPLISLVKLDDLPASCFEGSANLIPNFYVISLKRFEEGKIKYGQNYYDFDEGVLALVEPKQIFASSDSGNTEMKGWMLVFHPDFIRNYPLSKAIKEYGFFSYAVNEALHLSEKEEKKIGRAHV